MLLIWMIMIMRVMKLLSNVLEMDRHDLKSTLVQVKRVELIVLIYSEVKTFSHQPL